MEWTISDLFDLADFAHASLFEGCRYPWEALDRIKAYLNRPGKIEGQISPHAILEGEGITIGKGTVVEPGAYIKGPCWIGPNSEIRHGAYIRGNLITGEGCVVGHETEVKEAIFLNGAKAPHFAYVGDSILGNGVNLGAGVKLANFKLTGAAISVAGVDTGRRKLGAILGDEVSLGCNSVTNPGTLIGKGAVCTPCTSLGGVIGARQVIGERHVKGK